MNTEKARKPKKKFFGILIEIISSTEAIWMQNNNIFRGNNVDRSIKRLGDLFFSGSALILGIPVFLVLAALVKFSSAGPIFYIQERIGRKDSRFGCIKFRTMYAEADDLLSNLLAKSPSLKKEYERDFKLKKDPRITPIGRFLRRTSLDELPQFVNVFKGEMSIVGPRPIVEKEIPRYGKFMKEVYSVRPGMTGLWQVSGRNNLSYNRRIKLDLIYVRERNFILDLRVILRTFGVLLLPMDRGAY